jgi:protein TonB
MRGLGSEPESPRSVGSARRGGKSIQDDVNDGMFAAVLGLGGSAPRRRIVLGVIGTIMVHASTGYAAFASTAEFAKLARQVQESLRSRLSMLYEVQVPEAPPPPPPPEIEPPEPEPPPQRVARVTEPVERPAPPAAEAGKLIATEADPNEPLDLTNMPWVVGNAESFAGGVTSSKGSSKRPGSSTAVASGVSGGRGTSVRPAVVKNLSKPAMPAISIDVMKTCGFPPEADAEQVDSATVQIVVKVAADGSMKSVSVVSESPPGVGFGQRTKTCAMSRLRFHPGLNAEGRPVPSASPPITVRFTRPR